MDAVVRRIDDFTNPNDDELRRMVYLDRAMESISTMPTGCQIGIGGASGWVAGFLTMKVGKWVLWTAGAGILFMEYACYKGYIKVNWREIEQEKKTWTSELRKKVASVNVKAEEVSLFDKLHYFTVKNPYFVSGIGAGFLFGMGSA